MTTHSSETVFSNIFTSNAWGSMESVSGAGSELTNTAQVIRELPHLLRELQVRTFLDVPCGDFNWMQHVDLTGIDYHGADIVDALVERNTDRFARPGRRFSKLNLLSDELPTVDLILCRDCLFHFSHADTFRALHAVVASRSKWLLTTTFTYRSLPRNHDIQTGGWTPINLEMAPFNLPSPRRLIVEGNVTESVIYSSDSGSQKFPQSDRCLGLWLVDDVREMLLRQGR
ncbi:class I SAM-dependent methyltransferase [Variovorax sp. VaC1]|uniref:class I SAM-dependent methyltransferase n=1 Tax=Variovorax sp. VaC1 TaxID=3373132 RepID=UPI0037486856